MIIRFSEYVSQTLLIFITLSMATLLYAYYFQPLSSQYIEYGNIVNRRRLNLQYSKISVIYRGVNELIFYYYGVEDMFPRKIYLENYGFYNNSIQILKNGSWTESEFIPPKTFFKLTGIPSSNITKVYFKLDYSVVIVDAS